LDLNISFSRKNRYREVKNRWNKDSFLIGDRMIANYSLTPQFNKGYLPVSQEARKKGFRDTVLGGSF
jgi:hypothetical protein